MNRRKLLKLAAACGAPALLAAIARAEDAMGPQVYLPQIEVPPPPPPDQTETDVPVRTLTPSPRPTVAPTIRPTATSTQVIGPGSGQIAAPGPGSVEQAIAWLDARADGSYRGAGVSEIVSAYARWGDDARMDWFTAIAQLIQETGVLTSFWSLRPQRNPAGIGVDGTWSATQPPDTTGWAYNTQRGRWEKGLSFTNWSDASVPAHLGRLLAYALRDDQATPAQLALIQTALGYRPLPGDRRGKSPRWVDLNGNWAVPGTCYGQTLLSIARRMRGEPADLVCPPGATNEWVMPADG